LPSASRSSQVEARVGCRNFPRLAAEKSPDAVTIFSLDQVERIVISCNYLHPNRCCIETADLPDYLQEKWEPGYAASASTSQAGGSKRPASRSGHRPSSSHHSKRPALSHAGSSRSKTPSSKGKQPERLTTLKESIPLGPMGETSGSMERLITW